VTDQQIVETPDEDLCEVGVILGTSKRLVRLLVPSDLTPEEAWDLGCYVHNPGHGLLAYLRLAHPATVLVRAASLEGLKVVS
jgi:hypothetical protein